MTPLQQAAQAMIDRWESTDWKDTPHTAHYVAELRKALGAEIAQSVEPVSCGYDETTGNCTKNPCCNLSANQAEPVEPFAYFNIGTEYHVKGKIIFHKGLTPNLEDRWWGPDTPLYLHPPQPQATTPSIRQHCSECANWAKAVADTKEWADGVKIGREIIKKLAAAQGEKP